MTRLWDEHLDKYDETKKFEDVLIEAVDEAFSTLGEKVKTPLYLCLEQKFALPRTDIPYKLEEFSDALEKIFGTAAKFLEILIMKKMHEKVSCSYEWKGPKWLVPDLTFIKYVEMLRLWFEDKGKDKIVDFEVWIDAGEKQKQRI
jgi:hypothetical protein